MSQVDEIHFGSVKEYPPLGVAHPGTVQDCPACGYVLHDMADQPDFNPVTQNGRGDWSMRDVSAGNVYRDVHGKPACIDHGAMNCVVPDMSIWRCLNCGRAAYATRATIAEVTP